MLCAGVVHGDLSEFNVLVAADGPVIIDLPQAVDAAGNNHAFSMLERDVGNMASLLRPVCAGVEEDQVRQGNVGVVRGRHLATRPAL